MTMDFGFLLFNNESEGDVWVFGCSFGEEIGVLMTIFNNYSDIGIRQIVFARWKNCKDWKS